MHAIPYHPLIGSLISVRTTSLGHRKAGLGG